jgi:polysaccharide export outer membrane protein
MTLNTGLPLQCHCRNQLGLTVERLMVTLTVILLAAALAPLRSQEQSAPSVVNSSPSGPSAKQVDLAPADLRDYIISSDDLLEIYVFDVPDLTRQYRVSPNGTIQLPLLPEPIAAAGRTRFQLSQAISEHLRDRRLVANAQVTVEVRESRVHAVAITGAVKRPQIYPVFGQTTFLDLLSQAEGLTDDAGSAAIITRGDIARRRQDEENRQSSDTNTVKVDLKRLLEAENVESNPVVYPGDRVTVPHAGVFYVLGAVNRPGGYNLRDAQEPITVLMALATAGNMTPTAKSQKVVLIRKDSQSPAGREIPLNLQQIASGAAADQKMQPNDVLFVPESNGKKTGRAMLSAVGAVATTTTSGVLVYRR